MAREGTPAFTGLVLHRDNKWRISFWYPDGWSKLALAAGSQGSAYAPDAAEPATSFSYTVKNMRLKVSGEDLDALYEGFIEGLNMLPGIKIEWQDKWVVGALIGLEAKYTFTENEQTRKRWVRLLYETRRQFHIVAQGATVEEYAYWEPMLYECMATVKID
jgi:hypothetical protein